MWIQSAYINCWSRWKTAKGHVSKLKNCKIALLWTTNVLSGAVAKESVNNLKSTLSSSDMYEWFGFATNGDSDENDKFLPMLIRHFASNGLVTTSLLDMPDINKGSDSQVMFQTCNSSLMRASLSWETCCTYSSDNTSSVIGKNKSLLKLIKDAQSDLLQKYLMWVALVS